MGDNILRCFNLYRTIPVSCADQTLPPYPVLWVPGQCKAKTNIKNIRHALMVTTSQELQANQNDGVTCHKCNEGHRMTILVFDGYGNIVSDKVPDEMDQAEIEVILVNST